MELWCNNIVFVSLYVEIVSFDKFGVRLKVYLCARKADTLQVDSCIPSFCI
jgi:hypothetical protein